MLYKMDTLHLHMAPLKISNLDGSSVGIHILPVKQCSK